MAVRNKQLNATLAQSLAQGNVTGANDILVTSGQKIAGVAELRLEAPSGQDILFQAQGAGSATKFNSTTDPILNGAFSGAAPVIDSVLGALNAIQDGRVATSGGGNTAKLKELVVAEDGQTVFDIGEATTGVCVLFVRGIAHFGLFGQITLSTVTFSNDTLTWQELSPVGQLKQSDSVALLYYV